MLNVLAINFIETFFLSFLFPILLIFFLVLLTTILYEKIKYGNKVFSTFKPKDISSCRDELLALSLDTIPNYKKILKIPNYNSNYILIDKTGISLFLLFINRGIIKGEELDDSLKVVSNTRSFEKVSNPFAKLNNDEYKIKTLFPQVKINKYLVIMNDCNISVKTTSKIIKYNTLIYELEKNNLYNNNQVNEFYSLLIKNKCK